MGVGRALGAGTLARLCFRRPQSSEAPSPASSPSSPGQSEPSRKVSTALLLLHAGEPRTPEAALRFLRRRSRLFHPLLPDRLTDFVNNAWAYPTNPFLDARFGRLSGEESLYDTHERQGQAVLQRMATITPEFKPVKAYVAHHLAERPSQSIEAVLRRIHDDGPARVLVLPMQPHFWCFASKFPLNHLVQLLRRLSSPAEPSAAAQYGFSRSQIDAYARATPQPSVSLGASGLASFDPTAKAQPQRKGPTLRQLHPHKEHYNLSPAAEWSLMDRWGSHPSVADGWAKAIEADVEAKFPSDVRDSVALLFAAPNYRWYGAAAYRDQVAASAARIAENLQRPLPFRLAFFNSWTQFRLPTSPLRSLRYQLVDLLFQGYRNVLVVPLTSVAGDVDSLGTLPHLLPSQRSLKRLGAHTVRVLRPPGTSAPFVLGLGEMVKNHCLRGLPAPAQLPLHCELCVDPACLHTHHLFAPSPNQHPPPPV